MEYGLPTSVTINGEDHAIRTDFRVILEIFELLNDPELDQHEKAAGVIQMFYLDPDAIRDPLEALKACFRFIDRNKEPPKKKEPKTLDWEKDFEYIIAPVNRVLGFEARAVPYNRETGEGGLHWWSFLSAYMEIGTDCMLSQILTIRDKRAHGKQLSKEEKKWAARNAEIVALPTRYSKEEDDFFKQWAGGGG